MRFFCAPKSQIMSIKFAIWVKGSFVCKHESVREIINLEHCWQIHAECPTQQPVGNLVCPIWKVNSSNCSHLRNTRHTIDWETFNSALTRLVDFVELRTNASRIPILPFPFWQVFFHCFFLCMSSQPPQTHPPWCCDDEKVLWKFHSEVFLMNDKRWSVCVF